MVTQAQTAENKAIEAGKNEDIEKAHDQLQFAKSFRNYVLGRRKTIRIVAILTEARPKMQVDVTELDKDPLLLNTPSGIVDLRTGAIRPHDPADYCIKK